MKVYQIAEEAGMNPDQFCRIRNGCFADPVIKVEPDSGWGAPSNPFRGILASTRVSELLGVEPVAARDTLRRNTPTATVLQPPSLTTSSSSAEATHSANDRKWWFEVGDYLENPHRHFQAMDSLRLTVDWPDDVKALANSK